MLVGVKVFVGVLVIVGVGVGVGQKPKDDLLIPDVPPKVFNQTIVKSLTGYGDGEESLAYTEPPSKRVLNVHLSKDGEYQTYPNTLKSVFGIM